MTLARCGTWLALVLTLAPLTRSIAQDSPASAPAALPTAEPAPQTAPATTQEANPPASTQSTAQTQPAEPNAAAPPASAPEGQPATSDPPAASQPRAAESAAEATLLDTNAPLPERRAAARVLLTSADAAARTTILRTLSSGNRRGARIAIAQALGDLPASFTAEFVPPLLTMTTEAEADLRSAAADALAAAPPTVLIPALGELALDAGAAGPLRHAAITELGLRPERSATTALVAAARREDPAIQSRVLTALDQHAGRPFRGELSAALAWWDEAAQMPEADWTAQQLVRLIRARRASEQRAGELELRLSVALRDTFFRTPADDQLTLLSAYLNDPLPAVRLVGLESSRLMLTEGRAVSPEVLARVRELLRGSEPAVRLAAIRTLAVLRDTADAVRFSEQLRDEPNAEVRAALVNGLGYVGGETDLPDLLTLLNSPKPALAAEAAGAIGRFAERGVLSVAALDEATRALLARSAALEATQIQVRDQLLRAMYRIGDPRFAPVFIAAAAPSEPIVIRQAAVRGILRLAEVARAAQTPPDGAPPTTDAPLADTALAGAALRACDDTEPAVRRLGVEAAALLINVDSQLDSIWRRAWPSTESDPAVRDVAWRSVVRCLDGREATRIEHWLAQIPPDSPERPRRKLELLSLLEESLLRADSERGALGLARARLAAQRLAVDQRSDAVSAYRLSLADLLAAQHPDAPRVAMETLSAAMAATLYDSTLGDLLDDVQPPLDAVEAWRVVREALAPLSESAPERVVESLDALRVWPPTVFGPTQIDEIDQLYLAAVARRDAADARRVAEALGALRLNPEDAAARESIRRIGRRAAPLLQRELLAELRASAPDAARERLLVELLSTSDPDWSAYDLELPIADKRRMLGSE